MVVSTEWVALKQLCWSIRPVTQIVLFWFSTMKLQQTEMWKATFGYNDKECHIADKYTHTMIIMNVTQRHIKGIVAFFVRLNQHQNHFMKYQLYKWTLKFETALIFCENRVLNSIEDYCIKVLSEPFPYSEGNNSTNPAFIETYHISCCTCIYTSSLLYAELSPLLLQKKAKSSLQYYNHRCSNESISN